jgi:hypothetical protein
MVNLRITLDVSYMYHEPRYEKDPVSATLSDPLAGFLSGG